MTDDEMYDEGESIDDDREYCFECNNLGFIPCQCGGDICVCEDAGGMPCPFCERGW